MAETYILLCFLLAVLKGLAVILNQFFILGVGVSAAIVSYFVALYYNVILTWVIYYLYKSFRITLPWSVRSFIFLECF